MMCSAYRLNKQGDNRQSYCTLFSNLEPISCSIQGSNGCFLTHIQFSQQTGKMARYSHVFKSFPQFIMIHTVKGFSVVKEAGIDVFLEFPCFLYDPANVGNLNQRNSSSSLPSAIRVVSSAYLRLLIFLPPILILACNSSSLAFLMMCSTYRLNKQGDSRQPCHSPFSILNQSVIPYRVLTVAS